MLTYHIFMYDIGLYNLNNSALMEST